MKTMRQLMTPRFHKKMNKKEKYSIRNPCFLVSEIISIQTIVTIYTLYILFQLKNLYENQGRMFCYTILNVR